MKILILNVSRSNKGNRALVHSTLKIIRHFIPNTQFSFLGTENSQINGINVKKFIGYESNIKRPYFFVYYALISIYYLVLCILINLISKMGIKISLSENSKLYEYYNSDVIVNSGGDHFSGEYGIGVLQSILNVLYPILLGKPVVMFGESLGYYKNPIISKIARFVLKRMDLILVREKESLTYLYDNKISENVYLTAEPAFILDKISEKEVIKILNKESNNKIEHPVIGLNASGLITRFYNNENENIPVLIARVIDNLIDKIDANIILIPHVYTDGLDDDRKAIDNIYQLIENKSKVTVVENEYEPQELKGIIGQCDLLISSRMHVMIASTSMNIPTVGIAYSHKTYGIIGEMLELDECIININELTYEILESKIYSVWENRDEIKRKLETKIPMIKEKSLLNGKLFKELVDSLES